jgi:hypothetical protein
MEKEATRYAYLKVPGMLSHTQSDNSFTYFLCSSAKLAGWYYTTTQADFQFI